MPRDGQHYFEAVNLSRQLAGLGWVRVPPLYGAWGTGPWGDFSWGGDRVHVGPPPMEDTILFELTWTGGHVFSRAGFAAGELSLQVVYVYARPMNSLEVLHPFDSRLRYGGGYAQLGTDNFVIDDLIKTAGAWFPGRWVHVAVEIAPLGGAPLIRVDAAVALQPV